MDLLRSIVITDITDIITVSSPKGRFAEINNRVCYGLSFCREGKITYTHNGKKYISDSDHAVILPQGQSYTLYGDKTGIFPVINFKCMDFLCDKILEIPIRNTESYINDCEQMKYLSVFEKNRTKIISIFYDILHRLSSGVISQYPLLMPAIKYIENNYTASALTNTLLAQRCGISEVYFRKLFAGQFGMTPKQYIIDIRINKAKRLLTDGILKICAVSEQCGFSNPYHFCRVFKQKTGFTPTEYMKQNKIYKI